MKKIDLGQTIGILANLGVVAGIVFLAWEVGQNNEFLAAEARTAVLDRRTMSNSMIATSPELSNSLAKAADGESLTRGERYQIEAYNRSVLASFEWQFDEYQRGRLDLLDGGLGGWRVAYHNPDRPLFRETWARWRETAPEDFVEFFEENVVKRPLE